jgi:hypothetical protein
VRQRVGRLTAFWRWRKVLGGALEELQSVQTLLQLPGNFSVACQELGPAGSVAGANEAAVFLKRIRNLRIELR